jgi:hypothetical protein
MLDVEVAVTRFAGAQEELLGITDSPPGFSGYAART